MAANLHPLVRRGLSGTGPVLLGIVLAVWTLLPLYSMLMMALSPSSEVFEPHLWPAEPSAEAFHTVLTQGHFYVSEFWRQLGNSVLVAVMVTVLVLLVSSLASYAIVRQRPRWGHLLANAALASYVIPLSFLSIPLYNVIAVYGLLDTELALIIGIVAFAAPYAIWVLGQHANASLPTELDESAKVDGASAWQIYFRVYLPLMAPAMVAVGSYAFLLSWNEYLLAFLLLSSEEKMTLPVALASFLNSDQPPWNVLMAAALLYTIPPVVIYYAFRKHMAEGLTAGGVK
ncbi:carbohydrate ABC transporter permease [Pseudonocardia sichuanensis]